MRFLWGYLFTFLLVSFLASCSAKKHTASTNTEKPKVANTQNTVTNNVPAKTTSSNEAVSKNKPEEILDEIGNTNQQLKTFIAAWYATPYKYGGSDKSGIDCSHFASKLCAEIYKKPVSGPASAIEQQTVTVKTTEAQEGDLVFFKINGDKVSHVGVYISDNKFVHASTKRGVIISDLNEAYYKKYFYKTGRLK